MSHEVKTTLTWVALVALSLLSIAAAGHSHAGGQRSIMAVAVAAIAWVKGFMVIHQYLEAQNAGRFFYGAMLTFNTLAPLALVVSALRRSDCQRGEFVPRSHKMSRSPLAPERSTSPKWGLQ